MGGWGLPTSNYQGLPDLIIQSALSKAFCLVLEYKKEKKEGKERVKIRKGLILE